MRWELEERGEAGGIHSRGIARKAKFGLHQFLIAELQCVNNGFFRSYLPSSFFVSFLKDRLFQMYDPILYLINIDEHFGVCHI